jgi:putative transposase
MKVRKSTGPSSQSTAPSFHISGSARACVKIERGKQYFFDNQAVIFEKFGEDERLIFRVIQTELVLRVDRYDARSDIPTKAWLTDMIAVGRFREKSETASGITPARFMMTEEEARLLDPPCVIRYKILTQIDRQGEKLSDAKIKGIIERVLADHPEEAIAFKSKIAVTTAREWMKNRGAFQSRSWSDCLSMTGKGRRASRLEPSILPLVQENALFYWGNQLTTKLDAYTRLKLLVDLKNAQNEADGKDVQLSYPAFSTFLNYLNEFATYDTYVAKFGEVAARAKFLALGKAIFGKCILELVQIDHTELDVVAIDGPTGTVLGRPTLTIIICTRSRCILAVNISFEGPSLGSVFQALKRCLKPKIGCAGSEQFPILQDIFGLPAMIVFDNGLEFVGPSMQDSMADMGITLIAAKVKNPEFKPFVERIFSTLNNKLFHKVSGTSLNKQKQLKLGDSYKPEATLTLDELEELVEHAIYAYHIEPHSSLQDRPPALIWQEDATQFGIPVLFEQHRLDALLAASAPRTLSNDGIELEGLQYNHRPTTAAILESDQDHTAGTKRASIRTKIRYNPADLGCIWVRRPSTKEYVELPCVDQDYAAGLTMYQHKKILEHLKAKGLNFSSASNRQRAKQALSMLIYQIDPNSLVKQRKSVARLIAKPAIAKILKETGTESITGLTLLPHEALLGRNNDGGAIPEGTVRGATKAARTRAANELRRQKRQQIDYQLEGYDPEPDDTARTDFNENDWKGY